MKDKILFATLLAIVLIGCKTEEPEEQPVAKFTYSIKDKTVTFTNQSLHAKSYYWTFGDGSATSEKNPVKTYSHTGTYTVTLSTKNVNMSSSYAKEITIGENTNPNNPIASFDYTILTSDARQVQFTNKSSSDLYNFTWEFGDGDTSNEKNPEKYYWKNGTYTVRLTAWGSNSQQKYVCEKSITINSDKPCASSRIYIKGFKLYAIPSDGRYYKFSVVGTSWDAKLNFTFNTGYTEKLYISDLPTTFTLSTPKNLCSMSVWQTGCYNDLTVYVYQSTNTSESGTQCLKQIFFQGYGETLVPFRDEYIVASDNGQTRVGVLFGWADD